MASAVRAEFQQNGPVNTVEFGTIKDPTGFKNLLAMDAYYAVENGKTYPPVMFTTGLNDTRVDSWQPAKAAARMQAAGSPNPVLLRVEIEGGHGGGATKKQADELQTDVASFLFWRSGRPGWQPVEKVR
jgi:prolyl oligopeptidase